MFNSLNLLQSAIITMGVATATPIRNEAAVNDYTLTLQKTNSQTIYTNNVIINNTGVLDVGKIEDTKVRLTGGNAYLNIVGSEYTTKVLYSNDYTFRAEQFKSTVNTYNSYSSTEKTIIFKITPYNFNIDTETNVIIQVNMEDFEFEADEFISIQSVTMQRNLYTTTQENWDTYIDRQLTTDTNRYIIEDINNVNNNYYYTKTTTDINVPIYNNYKSVDDTFEISIVPQMDNYFVINYIPIINANYDGDPWDAPNVYVHNGVFLSGNITITGTNIIPTSTYEVIDIPGLMWEILTMPFAFVSQAFNLTLFPGTPYQLNISNLFLSLFAIVLFLWLIKFIINR